MEDSKHSLKKPRFTRGQKMFGAAGIGIITAGAAFFGVSKYNEKNTPPKIKTDYDPQNEIGI